MLLLASGCQSGIPGSSPSAAGSTGEAATLAPTAMAPLSSLSPSLPTPSLPPIDLSAVPTRLHVEATGATSNWIGPAGGTLSATASDGTVYRLEIPENAVSTPTPIAMTPITSVDDLGLSGGLGGAVFLQPAGLTLAEPARLHVITSRTAPEGARLVGFDVADDGQAMRLIPAGAGPDGVTALVFHFSAPGMAFGTTADLARMAQPQGGPLSSAMALLLGEDVPWTPVTMAEAFAGLETAYTNEVKPALTNAHDDQALLVALAEWRQFVFLLNLFGHQGDVAAALADGATTIGSQFPLLEDPRPLYVEGRSLAGNRIGDAVDGNTALCQRDHNLNALANIGFWAAQGERYEPDARNWDGLASACAKIVVGTWNPASNLRAGGSDSFQIAFVIQFSDGTHAAGDFQLALSGGGFTFNAAGAQSLTTAEAASQVLTIGVSAQQPPAYSLEASACWYLAGLPRNFCSEPVHESFGAPATPAPVGSVVAGAFGADCMVLAYEGTYSVFSPPLPPDQLHGRAQVATACKGRPATLGGLVQDSRNGGGEITGQSIQVWLIDGGPGGFTATELGCNNGNAGQPCPGTLVIRGTATLQGLSFTISATGSGELDYSFEGQLTGSVHVD